MIPKFRAWDKHGQKMFANDQLIIWNGNVYANDSKKLTCNNLKGWSIDDEYLMQSTGLIDKKGKEIFEGDVVKCNGLLGTIESFKAMWICSFVKYNNYQKVGFFAQEIEVVGNIYENPELLEDKK